MMKPMPVSKGKDGEFRCQFCGECSPCKEWGNEDLCPKCGLQYDPILLLDEVE